MVLAALVALVVSAAAMLTVPVAVRRMIDVGFAAHDGVFIDRYFVTLIGIGLVLAVASAGRMYAVNWLGERVVADLRADVFRHLATLGPAFYDRTHSGEVMSRLTADTTQIKAAAGSALSQALRNLIMLIGALTMMFVTSPTLAALGLAAIPVIVFPLLAYGRAVRRLSRAAQDRLADASAYAAENLGAVRTMHAFGQQATVSRRFAAASERAFDAARSRLLSRAGLTAIAIALIVSSIVGILWFGSRLVIGGEISGGRLGQFVLYAMFASGAIAELSEVWGEIAQAAGAAERLLELLAARSEVSEPARPRPMPVPPLGTDRLRGRALLPIPRARALPALNGVSFAIGHGETVAVVGPSGAGKSTIFNLILRFYDPQSGSVAVDGVPVAEVETQALRSRIALVPQDVALFDDTVAENIRYGAPEAGDAEVVRAAKAAQADGFIRAMAARLCNPARRAWRDAVRRPAPAHRARPRAPARRTDPAARRGDQRARRGKRAGRAGGAGPPDPEPHHPRHRPPAGHRAARHAHPGAGPGPHRRGGPARRAGAQGRALQPPGRAAVRAGRRAVGSASRPRAPCPRRTTAPRSL